MAMTFGLIAPKMLIDGWIERRKNVTAL